MRKIIIISAIGLLSFIISSINCSAQEGNETTAVPYSAYEDSIQLILKLNGGERPSIELNPGEEQRKKEKEQKKIKKRKKNVFYGIRSKKRFIRTKKGKNDIIEKFYVLREYQSPSPYVYEKTYFDEKEKKLVKTTKIDPKYGMPLHGTYLKLYNGDTIIHGIYHKGVKHGRWEKYGDDMQLLDKKYYYKGFPKESSISYHDSKQEKLKEIVPFQHNLKEGIYLAFYKSGRLKEVGAYKEDSKVGLWREFYDRDRRKEKKEIVYPKDPFSDKDSYVRRAWDEKGKQTIKVKRH